MDAGTAGRTMHDADAQARIEAARAMGRAKTTRKAEASRANGKSREGQPWTEEQKANLRARRAELREEKRERERAERIAAGLPAELPSPEPKKMGRPRLHPVADAPTRGRGRPKKQDAPTTAQASETLHNGTQEAAEA